MPLYDYVCAACGEAATLLVGLKAESPACPHCAATALEKQLTTFAIGGNAPAPFAGAAAEAPRKTGCASPGHVHGASCRAGSKSTAKGAAGCSPYTDSVVKKYLGD